MGSGPQTDKHTAGGQHPPDSAFTEPVLSPELSSPELSSPLPESAAQPTDETSTTPASNVTTDASGEKRRNRPHLTNPPAGTSGVTPQKQKRSKRKTPILSSDSEEDELPLEPQSKRPRLGETRLFRRDSEGEEELQPEFEVEEIIAFRDQVCFA
jgi:hypothetical protein